MMSENNKSYRIRTTIGQDKFLNVQLNQDYDIFEILSLKIDTEDLYKLHSSNYGCIVGRVVANGGVGVPNVKISMFIPSETNALEDPIMSNLYPYGTTKDKNIDNIRYNLLPADQISDCHQNIGTFPGKRLVLDDNVVLEMFDNYYKFTTVTNSSGDYMLFGVPTGNTMIHSDLDLSDIGFLSQKPRDLLYKGYNITQFENANMFKKDTNLDNLTQVISQDSSVYVYPFWGDSSEGEIKITRNDIEVSYKFQPTCVFMGSVFSDERSQGISKRCIPTDRMGKMDRLTTGQGTIEMIRKTPDGDVEPCIIEGNQLVDGNGTWCYQIPMNLDYMTTDEYGNLVPTDDVNKGIPTRTRARFRLSLSDYESDFISPHLVKVLIPNNPEDVSNVDYTFGTATRDDSYKDLFWNNIYSVKSYIPRIQKGTNYRNKNFTGIKAVNVNGANNPMPYNNMRVNLTFLFSFQCILFKILLRLIALVNNLVRIINTFASTNYIPFVTIDATMCKALEDVEFHDYNNGIHISQFYICPGVDASEVKDKYDDNNTTKSVSATIKYLDGKSITIEGRGSGSQGKVNTSSAQEKDIKSIEDLNKQADDTTQRQQSTLIESLDYFKKCVELQFAMEYEVIQFDFYNDWINGAVYIPRWFADIRRRKINKEYKDVVKACDDVNFNKERYLVQQCSLTYDSNNNVVTNRGCTSTNNTETPNNLYCHKGDGIHKINIFGKEEGKHGLVHAETTSQQQNVYYLKPCESHSNSNNPMVSKKVNFFATDIILLGSLDDNNIFGIPKMDKFSSSSYRMPPPTAQIVSDTQDMSVAIGWDVTFENEDGEPIIGFVLVNKARNKAGKIEPMSRDQIIPNGYSEEEYAEISGIDWGYNPFDENYTETGIENDSKKTIDLHGGHFLEIGCTNSAVNSRSCINLQRICEVGASISQTHEYQGGFEIQPFGFIGKREILDHDIRRKIAILNSNNLKTKEDKQTTFLRYDFVPYVTSNFDGSFTKYPLNGNVGITYPVEAMDNSYRKYRFGGKDAQYLSIVSDGYYTIPQYENSYYFYFGLSDGNTAIDRLYKNYFNECPKLVIPTNERIFTIGNVTEYKMFGYSPINGERVSYVVVDKDDEHTGEISVPINNHSETNITISNFSIGQYNDIEKLCVYDKNEEGIEPDCYKTSQVQVGQPFVPIGQHYLKLSQYNGESGKVMINNQYIGNFSLAIEDGWKIENEDDDNFRVLTYGKLNAVTGQDWTYTTSGLVHVMCIINVEVQNDGSETPTTYHYYMFDNKTYNTEYAVSCVDITQEYYPSWEYIETNNDYIDVNHYMQNSPSEGIDWRWFETVITNLAELSGATYKYGMSDTPIDENEILTITADFYIGDTSNFDTKNKELDVFLKTGQKLDKTITIYTKPQGG